MDRKKIGYWSLTIALRVSLKALPQPPVAGAEALIQVKNPEGEEALSKEYKVQIA